LGVFIGSRIAQVLQNAGAQSARAGERSEGLASYLRSRSRYGCG
jgi:hypothetical protein